MVERYSYPKVAPGGLQGLDGLQPIETAYHAKDRTNSLASLAKTSGSKAAYSHKSKSEVSLSRVVRAYEDDSAGALSGYGYGHGHSEYCPEGVPIEQALFAILAAFAASFGFLYTAITMITGRRRKRSAADTAGKGEPLLQTVGSQVADVYWLGLEEFEDKIDKIANGGNAEDESNWMAKLYKKFKGSFIGDDVSTNSIEMDGMEPPILDDKWGLDDISRIYEEKNNGTAGSNSTEATVTRTKRSAVQEIDVSEMPEETDFEDDYVKGLKGDAKCRTKFWRCVSKVAKGSLHYMQEPGGLSGAFQKTMFRMAFHGGFGNVWNALMTIPEARSVKRCMNAQDACISYETLRAEADSESAFAGENANPRLIVNPEFVENIDTSDGRTQFDADVQEAFENEI